MDWQVVGVTAAALCLVTSHPGFPRGQVVVVSPLREQVGETTFVDPSGVGCAAAAASLLGEEVSLPACL